MFDGQRETTLIRQSEDRPSFFFVIGTRSRNGGQVSVAQIEDNCLPDIWHCFIVELIFSRRTVYVAK